MHYYTLVVVDPHDVDTADRDAIGSRVERLLAPFDENAETEGERVYLEEYDLQRIAEAYAIALPAPDAEAPQRPAVRGGLRAQLAGAGQSGTVTGPAPDRARALEKVVAALPGWWGDEGGMDDDGRVWAMSYSNPDGQWDWWIIGGRWSGVLDGYDPGSDPRNQEVCSLCQGSGTRPGGLEKFGAEWAKNCNGCNGCNGNGKSTKWPTEWAAHAGDVARVADLIARTDDDSWVPAALLDANGTWHSSNARLGASYDWIGQVRALLADAPANALAVVVDCHA